MAVETVESVLKMDDHVEMRRCEGVGMWKCGGVEVWRCGGVEV